MTLMVEAHSSLHLGHLGQSLHRLCLLAHHGPAYAFSLQMVGVTIAERSTAFLTALAVRGRPAALEVGHLKDAVAVPSHHVHPALSLDVASTFQGHDPRRLAMPHADGGDADGIVGVVVEPSLAGQFALRLLLAEDGIDGLADLAGPSMTLGGSEEMMLDTPNTGVGVFFFVDVFVVGTSSERAQSTSLQNSNLRIPSMGNGIVLGLGRVQLSAHTAR